MRKPLAIQCEDGTVLNCAHVVAIEVIKGGAPDTWKIIARTTLDANFHPRTVFLVQDRIESEAEARSRASFLLDNDG